MKPCLVCGRPGPGPRCNAHQREWERTVRQVTHPQRKAYADPAYKRYRAVILASRPDCYLCGEPGADTLDHVVPLIQGGTNHPTNLRPAHRACNVRKHDMTRQQNWPPLDAEPTEAEASEAPETAEEVAPAPDAEEPPAEA